LYDLLLDEEDDLLTPCLLLTYCLLEELLLGIFGPTSPGDEIILALCSSRTICGAIM